MNTKLRQLSNEIVNYSIKEVLPDIAVKKAISNMKFDGRIFVVSVGKAAWQMANATYDILNDKIHEGIIITKYGHLMGEINKFTSYEAGHPICDENSFKATEKVIELVSNLNKDDTVLFLLSGGGSALFEKPLITTEELKDINKQLLSCGANIVEINTIRKRLSSVKGGKFANLCMPARIVSIILSDVLGDKLDMIASGPTAIDTSTNDDIRKIIDKYNLIFSDEVKKQLFIPCPNQLSNTTNLVMGSVKELCISAKHKCEQLGYKTNIITDYLFCEAKEAGKFIASIANTYASCNEKIAFIFGGETVVHLHGSGSGGRNQELVLSAAPYISNLNNVAIFSFGSDGTDGPTDAAGGYVDGDTFKKLEDKNIDIYKVLDNNDSYHALKAIDNLIITGPTGTNVNDVSILLIN